MQILVDADALPNVIKDILTKSPAHPHGIKVHLESGVVGRVNKILSEDS